MSSIYIETERLLLRPLQLADAEPLATLWSDPQVTRYLGGPRNYAQLVADFRADVEQPVPFDLWPTLERATGQVIGHCGLLDKTVEGHTEVELTYVFSPTVWGRGYATEISLALRDYAFYTLTLPRLIALIDPAHQGSIHVAQKVGLTWECDTMRPDGKVKCVYSLARPNY